jgi:hypothetical protein
VDDLVINDDLRSALTLAFEALSNSQRRKISLVEYRCRQRHCQLLTVWRHPTGLYLYESRAQSAPLRRNPDEPLSAVSVTDQRRRSAVNRTLPIEDARAWRPADPELPDVTANTVAVSCDHVIHYLPRADVLAAAAAARTGSPTLIRL